MPDHPTFGGSMPAGKQKRASRIPVRFMASIESDGQEITGIARDLSRSGMLVHVPIVAAGLFGEGLFVNVSFELPRAGALTIRGTVARCSEGVSYRGAAVVELGIRLTPDLSDEKLLKKAIARTRPKVLFVGCGEKMVSGLRRHLPSCEILSTDQTSFALDALDQYEIAAMCVGADLRGLAAAALVEEATRAYPGNRTLNIVAAGGADLTIFQDLVNDDRVFFLSAEETSAANLAPIVTGAVDKYLSEAFASGQVDEERGAAELLPRILEISRGMTLQQDVASAGRLVIDAIDELIGADRAYYLIYDDQEHLLWSRTGDNDELREESAVAGLVSYVARAGVRVVVDDVGQDPRYDQDADDPAGAGNERLAAIPVLSPRSMSPGRRQWQPRDPTAAVPALDMDEALSEIEVAADLLFEEFPEPTTEAATFVEQDFSSILSSAHPAIDDTGLHPAQTGMNMKAELAQFKVLAVLVAVRSAASESFSTQAVETLELLAKHAAPALEQLVLREKVEEDVENLRSQEGVRSLYREEALDHHHSGAKTEGDVLQISPPWTRSVYLALVVFVIVMLAFMTLARVKEYARGPAVIMAEGRTIVTATSPSTVTTIPAGLGQRVKKGQVLVRFHYTRELEAYRQVNAEYEIQLKKLLRDPGDTSAQQSVMSLRATRNTARAALSARFIRAPESGIISDIRVRPGQLVNPGDILLTISGKEAQYKILALLPGHYRPQVKRGMPIRFELAGYKYTYQQVSIRKVGDGVISPNEARRYLGKQIEDAVQIPGSVFLLEAVLPRSTFKFQWHDHQFHDGMYGTAEVAVRSESILFTLLPSLRGALDARNE